MRTVSGLFLAATLFVSPSLPAFAETNEASIPASDVTSTYQLVLDKCIEVSENPEIADPEDGICVTQTKNFVTSLLGRPSGEVEQILTDLVIDLAELPRLNPRVLCDEFEDEIAQAIIIASESSSDRLQRERFLQIADTIAEECDSGLTTATIVPLESGRVSEE